MLSFVSKRDNILHARHFYAARMAQFPCMFVIELILSTDLKDFFAVLSRLFFVKVYKRELRC